MAAPGELGNGHCVILVAVDAARRDQPEAVERAAPCARAVDCGTYRRVLVEAAVLDRPIDPGKRLIDQPPRADREMPHFRIALLTGREPYRLAAGVNGRMRPPALKRVELRCARRGDGVAIRIGIVPPPVENDEHERSHATHAAMLGSPTRACLRFCRGDDDAELLRAEAHATD